jgi:hypothetical protein
MVLTNKLELITERSTVGVRTLLSNINQGGRMGTRGREQYQLKQFGANLKYSYKPRYITGVKNHDTRQR